MADNQMMQVIKLFKLVDCLAARGGATLDEIREALDISERSAHRWLQTIEELGFPLCDEESGGGRGKRYSLLPTYTKKLPNMTVPDAGLQPSEVLAFYFLKGQDRLFQGTVIEKNLDRALTRMASFLSAKVRGNFERIGTLILPNRKLTKDYAGKESIIEKLTQAILSRRSCRVRYHSFSGNRIKSFTIDPLHFFENKGGLYLLVRTTDFDHIRTLAIERIEELTPTDQPYQYPTDVDPEKMLEQAFDFVWDDPIRVKVWFSASQAPYIKERIWPESSTIDDQADGSIILTLNTSGRWDVKRWVLSYGAEARVLEPEDLRDQIVKELEAACGTYAADRVERSNHDTMITKLRLGASPDLPSTDSSI